MDTILKSFSNKKFKYGTFSTLAVVFVLTILVFVNLVFSQLNLTYDLTKDKLYSLSEDTIKIINEINEDVTIYPLFKTGQENQMFKDLLNEYQAKSSRIKVIIKDPYLYPTFVDKYAKGDEEILADSVIVESAKRYKVINAGDMLSYDFDYNTYQSYIKSIDVEPQVTNAIKYVTDESTANVYVIKGHNEDPLPEKLITQLKLANYNIEDLDVIAEREVPADCKALIITSPKRDWTLEEADIVKKYLMAEGRAIVFMDYTTEPMNNIESVLQAFGVQFGQVIVVEGNTKNYFQNTPQYLIPDFKGHDTTKKIENNGYRMLLPLSRSIEELPIKEKTTTIEPILVSSSDSYGKTNPASRSVNREPGDTDGPFNLAVAITSNVYTDRTYTAKIIAVGTTSILDDSVNSYIRGSNFDFIVESVNWLQDKANSVYIRPKTSTGSNLFIDQGTMIVIMFLSVIVLPVIILGIGLFIWLRRRNS